MSDLISRNELMEEIKSLSIVLNGKLIFSDDAKDTVLRIINEQPTAYDIDKVVEELERIRAKKTCNKEKCDTKEICRICVVDDAIEIVKQGGVSDDVCEWEKGSSGYVGYNAYYSKCCTTKSKGIEAQNHIIKDWKYCPYCGKKIKVVE